MSSIFEIAPMEATKLLRDISVTERSQFRSCRRRWNLQTLENLQPKNADQTALPFGSGVHKALETYYLNDRDVDLAMVVFQECRDKWELDADTQELYETWVDLGEIGYTMLEHYFEFDKVAKVQVGDVLAVEGQVLKDFGTGGPSDYPPEAEVIQHPSGRLMVPIVNPDTKIPVRDADGNIVYLTAKIDLLTERKTPKKGFWIVDHKTAASAPSDKTLDFDDQATGYCYVVYRWLDVIVRGIVWNVLIKEVPGEPRIVQDRRAGMKGLDTLSSAKDQLTLPSMYREALDEWGYMTNGRINSEKHSECLDALLSRGWDPFYRRFELTRNEHELAMFEYRLFNEYQDMVEAARVGEDKLYPNATRMCAYCQVNKICLSIEDGSDWEDVVERQYIVGPDRKALYSD